MTALVGIYNNSAGYNLSLGREQPTALDSPKFIFSLLHFAKLLLDLIDGGEALPVKVMIAGHIAGQLWFAQLVIYKESVAAQTAILLGYLLAL